MEDWLDVKNNGLGEGSTCWASKENTKVFCVFWFFGNYMNGDVHVC